MTEDQTSVDPDDVAPDADDAGDDFPQELANLVHEGDIVPDNVDKPDPEDQVSDEESTEEVSE